MRMEELANSQYIKQTDSVEKYLLGVIQEYFKNNSNVANVNSREFIIRKTLERIKEELNFEEIGVTSVTLPDGIKRTGAVTITLEELEGEPIISPKLSAFNVSFGDKQNTACEGNDPRLFDAREPLFHTHEINNIIGLEGALSTINGKIDRVSGFIHEHQNMSVLNKITYTGEKDIIDLTVIDTLEPKIIKIIEEIQNDINKYKNETDTKINTVYSKIEEIKQEIPKVKQYVLDTNKEYYNQAKTYTNETVNTTKETIMQEFEKYVTKTAVSEVVSIANQVYTLISEVKQQIFSDNGSIDVASAVQNEVAKRGKQISDCKIEPYIQYQKGSDIVMSPLPYAVIKNNKLNGIIRGDLNIDTLEFYYNVNYTADLSQEDKDEIYNWTIILKVYSQQVVTL